MTKSRKKRGDKRKPARPARLRMMLVVDRAEVRSIEGCLTLRVSDVDGDPTSIVVPGESALGLLGNIREAVLNAEEQYWRVVVPFIKRLGAPNPDAVARAMSKWHRTQGWERAAKHVRREDMMFLLTNAGHVAIGALPPASPHPLLAIFDPLQLRRISQGMESATHQALQEMGSGPWPMRALAAHEFLAAQPWRQPDTYRDPSVAEAAEWMKTQYTEHLRRTPYVPPAEHILPL